MDSITRFVVLLGLTFMMIPLFFKSVSFLKHDLLSLKTLRR